MRIFNWVQAKIYGKQEKIKVEPAYPSAARFHIPSNTGKEEEEEEEVSGWPRGLLAIGTFGNSTAGLRGDQKHKDEVPATPPQGVTVEEVDRLQKELARLLDPDGSRKPRITADAGKSCRTSSDDVSRRRPTGLEIDVDITFPGDGGELSPTSRVILSKGKDALGENRINAINQRSFSFLFKKIFSRRRRGFAPAPSLRDPLQASIMEKFLKATVDRKIYPQNASPVSTWKKQVLDGVGTEGKTQRASATDGSKWDRTDSEYIVLEI